MKAVVERCDDVRNISCYWQNQITPLGSKNVSRLLIVALMDSEKLVEEAHRRSSLYKILVMIRLWPFENQLFFLCVSVTVASKYSCLYILFDALLKEQRVISGL